MVIITIQSTNLTNSKNGSFFSDSTIMEFSLSCTHFLFLSLRQSLKFLYGFFHLQVCPPYLQTPVSSVSTICGSPWLPHPLCSLPSLFFLFMKKFINKLLCVFLLHATRGNWQEIGKPCPVLECFGRLGFSAKINVFLMF